MTIKSVTQEVKDNFLDRNGDWRHLKDFSGKHKKEQILRSPSSGKFWHLFPDWKVFVNGIDFSEFCTSITINHNNLGQPSTCSVNMVNPELLLNYSKQNAQGAFGSGGERLESKFKKNGELKHSEKIMNVFGNGEYNKQQMYLSKSKYQMGIGGSDMKLSGGGGGATYPMWALAEGDCCIDSNDPVRIFFKNPYIGHDEKGGSDPQWYFAFTGFIDSVTESEDSEMNGTISFTASDVRKLMKNSRMATNNGVNIPLMDQARAGMLQKDCEAPGSYTTKFANMTMTQIITAAINGTDFLTNGKGNIEIVATNPSAIDPTIGMASGEKIGALGEWYTHIHAIEKSGESKALTEYQKLFDMRLPLGTKEDGETQNTVFGIGLSTGWGKMNFPGNRYNNANHDRLIILVPEGGFVTDRNITERDPRTNFSLYTEFVNRLDVLNEMVSSMEMEFYCSPAGDLVFEVKLYSTYPWDYGDHWGVANWLNQEDWGVLQEHDGIQNFSITDSDAEVQTFVRTTGRFQNMSAFGDEINLNGLAPLAGAFGLGKPISDKLNEFQPISTYELGRLRRFGLRYLQRQLPHIYDHKFLQIYAEALYQMLQSNIKSASVTLLPNFELGVNRPFLLSPRKKLFTIQNISHSISWNGSAETTLSLNYPRAWVSNKFEEFEHPFLIGSGTQKEMDPEDVKTAAETLKEKNKKAAKSSVDSAKKAVDNDPTLSAADKAGVKDKLDKAVDKATDPQEAADIADKVAKNALDNNKKAMDIAKDNPAAEIAKTGLDSYKDTIPTDLADVAGGNTNTGTGLMDAAMGGGGANAMSAMAGNMVSGGLGDMAKTGVGLASNYVQSGGVAGITANAVNSYAGGGSIGEIAGQTASSAVNSKLSESGIQ